MKAAVTRSFDTAPIIEEVMLAPPEIGEIAVAVKAVAICGSDLHAMGGAWGGCLPTVFGHEAAGVVTRLGHGVTGIEVGQPVVVSLVRSCGECFYCRRGERHICSGRFALASSSRLSDADGQSIGQGISVGAFAEAVVVHQSQVVAIPRSIPFETACLLSCGVITGYGAVVNTAEVEPDTSVAVIGVGGVGLNCVQGAVASQAETIVAVDTAGHKRDSARLFGATHAFTPGAQAIEGIRGVTGGRGADYVFVAVGSAAAIEAGLEYARPGGTLVVVGMTRAGDHANIETSEFAASSQRVIGSKMGSADLKRDVPELARRYLAGGLKLDELISGRFPLDDIDLAIAEAKSGKGLRNVITVDGAP